MIRRRNWYYFTMFLFVALGFAYYFQMKEGLAQDLAPYMLGALVFIITMCAAIVLLSQGKSDEYLVSMCHLAALRGLQIGMVGWVPVMAYIKTYARFHAMMRPPGPYSLIAFLTGGVVCLSGLALIYQYIMYGVTWILCKARIIRD